MAAASSLLSTRDSNGSRRSGRSSYNRVSPINSPTFSEADPLLTSSSDPLTYSRNNEDPETTPPHTATPVFLSAKKRVSCQRCCYDRVPKGKASLLIFLVNVVETFAFFSAVDGALNLIFGTEGTAGYTINLALQYSVGRLAYPLAGFIADVYLGRYKVIHIGLWMLLVAHCILAITLSLNGYLTTTAARYVFGVLAYALVSVGSASIEANIIPFGVDQLSQGPSSAEISSYFYWYYFGRQLGVLVGLLMYLALTAVLEVYSEPNQVKTWSSLPSVMVVLALAVAILLYYYLRKWLYMDTARPNALKLVVKVIWYAAGAKRQFPRYRRAFRYGERRKPRIELVKIDYDGIYERKDVEDVKSICQIVLLLSSLCGYSVSYNGAYIMLSFEIGNLFSNVTNINSGLQLYFNVFVLCNIVTIMVFLPILNHIVIPCFPSLNMKKRIGLGMILNVCAVAVAAILESTVHGKSFEIQLLWFLLPSVLLAIAEAFVVVSSLEFIYAQTPESAKGLLTGTFYFFWGLFNIGGLLLFYFILQKCPLHFPNKFDGIDPILYNYVILFAIGAVGFVMYTITAWLYTNRQRPNVPADESYFESRRNIGDWAYP